MVCADGGASALAEWLAVRVSLPRHFIESLISGRWLINGESRACAGQ